MYSIETSVLENRPEGGDSAVLTFEIPRLQKEPMPGQFYIIKLLTPGFPMFGRAFAVLDYQEKGDRAIIQFLIKEVGQGTAFLRIAKPGDPAGLVGPAGNCFPKMEGEKSYILVGGGTGIAAFYYLLLKAQPSIKERTILLYGARDRASLYLYGELSKLHQNLKITTENGEVGEKGLITSLLKDEINNPDALVFACGPDPMMKAITDLTLKKGIKTYLSLETRMACGIGVCNGCAVQVTRNGVSTYARVCHEGPVFNAANLTAFS